MMGQKETPKQETKSARTAAREAFFLEFAHETRKRFPSLILMLTGGFRTRAGALSAIRDNACDLIGIGRPSAVDPKLPLLMLDESVADEEAGLPLVNVPVPFYVKMLPARSVGGGLESVCFLLSFLLFFSSFLPHFLFPSLSPFPFLFLCFTLLGEDGKDYIGRYVRLTIHVITNRVTTRTRSNG